MTRAIIKEIRNQRRATTVGKVVGSLGPPGVEVLDQKSINALSQQGISGRKKAIHAFMRYFSEGCRPYNG